MSRLNDAIDHAQHILKQARQAVGQREKVNGIVQAHDVLYAIGVQFYEAKSLASRSNMEVGGG